MRCNGGMPRTLAALGMAAVVIAVRHGLPADVRPWVKLLGQSLVGAGVYSTIIFTVHGDRLRTVRTLLRSVKTPPRSGDLVHDSGPTPATDRLILVSYHFPPDTAIGALRWRKLARYAAERGWEFGGEFLDVADGIVGSGDEFILGYRGSGAAATAEE